MFFLTGHRNTASYYRTADEPVRNRQTARVIGLGAAIGITAVGLRSSASRTRVVEQLNEFARRSLNNASNRGIELRQFTRDLHFKARQMVRNTLTKKHVNQRLAQARETEELTLLRGLGITDVTDEEAAAIGDVFKGFLSGRSKAEQLTSARYMQAFRHRSEEAWGIGGANFTRYELSAGEFQARAQALHNRITANEGLERLRKAYLQLDDEGRRAFLGEFSQLHSGLLSETKGGIRDQMKLASRFTDQVDELTAKVVGQQVTEIKSHLALTGKSPLGTDLRELSAAEYYLKEARDALDALQYKEGRTIDDLVELGKKLNPKDGADISLDGLGLTFQEDLQEEFVKLKYLTKEVAKHQELFGDLEDIKIGANVFVNANGEIVNLSHLEGTKTAFRRFLEESFSIPVAGIYPGRMLPWLPRTKQDRVRVLMTPDINQFGYAGVESGTFMFGSRTFRLNAAGDAFDSNNWNIEYIGEFIAAEPHGLFKRLVNAVNSTPEPRVRFMEKFREIVGSDAPEEVKREMIRDYVRNNMASIQDQPSLISEVYGYFYGKHTDLDFAPTAARRLAKEAANPGELSAEEIKTGLEAIVDFVDLDNFSDFSYSDELILRAYGQHLDDATVRLLKSGTVTRSDRMKILDEINSLHHGPDAAFDNFVDSRARTKFGEWAAGGRNDPNVTEVKTNNALGVIFPTMRSRAVTQDEVMYQIAAREAFRRMTVHVDKAGDVSKFLGQTMIDPALVADLLQNVDDPQIQRFVQTEVIRAYLGGHVTTGILDDGLIGVPLAHSSESAFVRALFGIESPGSITDDLFRPIFGAVSDEGNLAKYVEKQSWKTVFQTNVYESDIKTLDPVLIKRGASPFANPLKWYKEVTAGAHDVENITTSTLFPWALLERLNPMAGRLAIGLGPRSVAKGPVGLFTDITLKRVMPLTAAGWYVSYLNRIMEMGDAPGEGGNAGLFDMAMDLRAGWSKTVAVAESWTGIRAINRRLAMTVPGYEQIQELPVLGGFFDHVTAEDLKKDIDVGWTAVRSGRWWLTGSRQPVTGGRIKAWVPNIYQRARSDWQEAMTPPSLFWQNAPIPTPENPLGFLKNARSYWFEEQYKDSRPYPISATPFDERHWVMPLVNLATTKFLKPPKYHEEYDPETGFDKRELQAVKDMLAGKHVDESKLKNNLVLEHLLQGNQIEGLPQLNVQSPTTRMSTPRLQKVKDGWSYKSLTKPFRERVRAPLFNYPDVIPKKAFTRKEYRVVKDMLEGKDIDEALLKNNRVLEQLLQGNQVEGLPRVNVQAAEEVDLENLDGALATEISKSISKYYQDQVPSDYTIFTKPIGGAYQADLSDSAFEGYDESYIANELAGLYADRGVAGPPRLYEHQAEMPRSIRSPHDPRSHWSTQGKGTEDMVGFYGFSTTAFLQSIGVDREDTFNEHELETRELAISPMQSYWRSEFGGMPTEDWGSELGRRFVPRRSGQQRMWNPMRNEMPSWLPGPNSFKDFTHGDPYVKSYGAEYLLPGKGRDALFGPADLSISHPTGSMLGMDEDSMVNFLLGRTSYDKITGDTDATLGGTAVHATYQQIWKEQGRLAGAEVHVRIQDVTGLIDAIVDTPSGPMITEIKTKSTEAFHALEGPQKEHVSQLNFYLLAMGAKRGAIYYTSRDDPTLTKIFYVDASERMFNDDLRRVRRAQQRVKEMLESGEVSEAELYTDFEKFRTLSSVAPFSDEYTFLERKMLAKFRAGRMEPDEWREVRAIRARVKQVKVKKRLYPYVQQLYPQGEEFFGTIEEITNPGEFKIKGDDRTYRLAGIDMDLFRAAYGQVVAEDDPDRRSGAKRLLAELGFEKGARVQIVTDGLEQLTQHGKKVVYASTSINAKNISRELVEAGFTDYDDDYTIQSSSVVDRGMDVVSWLGEKFMHLDTPFHTKFSNIRTPGEEWDRGYMYGATMGSWDTAYRDYAKPIMWSFMGRNPIMAAGRGFMIGSFFTGTHDLTHIRQALRQTADLAGKERVLGAVGRYFYPTIAREAATTKAKVLRSLTGGKVGMAVAMGFSVLGMFSKPKPRVTQYKNEEYWDKIKYLKHSAYYDSYMKQAKEQEKKNIQTSVRAGVIPPWKQKAVWDLYKEKWDRYEKDSTDPELRRLNREITELTGLTTPERLGVFLARANIHRNLRNKTAYGADTSKPGQVAGGMPAYARQVLMAGAKTKQDRDRIWKSLPQYLKESMWELYGKDPVAKKDIVDYFRKHTLPGPEWEGWKEEVDLKPIKDLYMYNNNPGLNPLEFGVWPMTMAQTKEIVGDIPIPVRDRSNTESDVRINMRRLLDTTDLEVRKISFSAGDESINLNIVPDETADYIAQL